MMWEGRDADLCVGGWGPLTDWDRDTVVSPMMFHPYNAEWREELQAYFMAEWLIDLGPEGIKEHVDLITPSRLQTWRHTPAEEVHRRALREARRGSVAGEVLLTIRRQYESGHAGSVGKAMYLLTHTYTELYATDKTWPKSRSSIAEAWTQFKPVAHLWAAYLVLHGCNSHIDDRLFICARSKQ